MNSISAENLAVAYDDNLVVEDLNIELPKGKITSIIGPNGCGKSTVLKAMSRIIKAKNGIVYLNGKDIRQLTTKEVAQKMASLPQSPQAPDGLTVGELVAYGRFPHQRGFGKLNPNDKEIIQWVLEVTKLEEFETVAVDTLSGGQRQRVWIAMALAQQTDLIFLDEPTTYLDMAYQLEVLELLQKLNLENNCSIVMVLHDINLAARFSDFIVAVRSGKIIAQGTPEHVITKKVLEDTFNIDAELNTDPRTGRPVCVSYHVIRKGAIKL